MRNVLLALFVVLAGGTLAAQNLITDFDCGQDPDTGEFAIVDLTRQGKLSRFREDDGNTCLKFELVRFTVDKNGKRKVGTELRFGGNKQLNGFPCKPETVYKFSLAVRGNAARAMINAYEWNDVKSNSYRHRKKIRADIHLIRPAQTWTVYSGTFKTGPDAKRAALGIQFWGDESRRDLAEKIGQYILIDKITVEEVNP